MITEDYVSFEVAKLLKEKGFDECCRAFITPNVDFALESDGHVFNHILLDNEYAAPTLQMAMKWLREVYTPNTNIVLDIVKDGVDSYVFWTYNLCQNENYKLLWGDKRPLFNTYEEAVEAAIIKVLKELPEFYKELLCK